MVRYRSHRSLRSEATALLVVLQCVAVAGLGSDAGAADSIQSLHEWERPAEELQFKRSPAPSRKATDSVPVPFARERWKKAASQPQEMKRDKVQAVQPPHSADVNRPHAEVPSPQNISQTGPVIVGRVVYRGSVPPPEQVEVTRDAEVCGPTVNVVPLSVDPVSYGVRNAVVYNGVGGELTQQVSLPVSAVENKQCAFYPRVAASRVGSFVEISNIDPLMHNTNMTVSNRTILNVALVAGGNSIRKPLKSAGLYFVKCNVHKFMQAYRYVFDHPFFAQTNDAGQYQIAGLSPGLHTVSVWHETLGVLQKDVQVPMQGTVTVDFEFK